MISACAKLTIVLIAASAAAQEHVTFATEDGGTVSADVYGKGDRGLVLAHGGRFNKESWSKQARDFEQAGYRAVAIDFRGRGKSHAGKAGEDGYRFDVVAAIRYLRDTGVKTVSIIGGSFGGDEAAKAAMEPGAGAIDRLVMLAAWTDHPEKLKCRKLFIVARDDANDDGPRLPKIRECYEKAPEPKKLVVLEGSEHAQFLFATDRGRRVMQEILAFLSEP